MLFPITFHACKMVLLNSTIFYDQRKPWKLASIRHPYLTKPSTHESKPKPKLGEISRLTACIVCEWTCTGSCYRPSCHQSAETRPCHTANSLTRSAAGSDWDVPPEHRTQRSHDSRRHRLLSQSVHRHDAWVHSTSSVLRINCQHSIPQINSRLTLVWRV